MCKDCGRRDILPKRRENKIIIGGKGRAASGSDFFFRGDPNATNFSLFSFPGDGKKETENRFPKNLRFPFAAAEKKEREK